VTKTCTKCGIVYPEPFEKWFYKHPTCKDGFHGQCKKCRYKAAKKWNKTKRGKESFRKSLKKYAISEKGRKKRKTTNRRNLLKLNYNITIDEYDKMFRHQQGCCAICGIHQTELKKRLFVDHDHKTGKVRGLLCPNCNRRLGVLENENFKIVAGEYLKNAQIC